MSTKNKLYPIPKKPVIKRIRQVPQGAISYDAKTIIVILVLLFIYPLGVIFMWIWMVTWPRWLKCVISIPFFLAIIVLGLIFAVAIKNIKDFIFNF